MSGIDTTARLAWARLTTFIQKVTGHHNPGSQYSYNYDNATGNASLKMFGTTYRYSAASVAEGREGCAREAISKGVLYKLLDEARPHPGRLADLKKQAAALSNVNRLPAMSSLFSQTRPPPGPISNGYQSSPNFAYQGVPPNVPSLSLPSAPSAYQRLQDFIADIYGPDCNVFEQIEFAQSKEGQSSWSIIMLGREYLCKDHYTDKKAGQEAAVREALEKGALSAMIRDRPPPVNYQASAMELAAKFQDMVGLWPLPAPAPIPSGSRTPMPGQMGGQSPFHPAMAGGASPYQATVMAGAQSPYHANTMNGGQSPYHAGQSPYHIPTMHGGQSPYHMPAQSPYINGYGAHPNGNGSVSGRSPRRARSGSRRRSRSPRHRSKARHRSRSRHRSKSRSRRDRSRSDSCSSSASASSRESRTRRPSSRRGSHLRRSRSKRRRSRTDSDGEDRKRKKASHRRGRSRSTRSRRGTEEPEQQPDEAANATSQPLPPVLSVENGRTAANTVFGQREVNQELSPFLDYILDCLEPKAPVIKEDTPEIQISMDEGAQNGQGENRNTALLARLDSSNREKLHLIRQACTLSLAMQNIKSALDTQVDAGDVVVLPRSWVKEVLQCLAESS